MIYIIPFLFLLASCGGSSAGPCAGNQVGSWTRGDGDIFSFAADCSFTYRGTVATCTETGTYGAAFSSGGTATLTVPNGGTCLPEGETNCSYNLSGDLLVMECGWGQMSFGRN
jgi:hypothetical protein